MVTALQRFLVCVIRRFPKGSIWQTRYIVLPASLVASTLALTNGPLDVMERVAWFSAGVVLWTLLEYVLHRWVLHWRACGPVGRALMDRLHVQHHHDPADQSQVCMPLAFAAPGWALVCAVFILFGGNAHGSLLVTCGIALMMTIYDITHFSAHYMKPTNAWLEWLKKHHMAHHFSDATRRFGVTSPIWDHVFRTLG